MKSSLIASAIFVASQCAVTAQADTGGSCHFHGSKPATEAVVTDCANKRRDALVKAGKLEASWQSAKPDAVALVDGKKGKEWKVSFKNPAVADKNKQTLFVFFSQPGNFIAANFTGE